MYLALRKALQTQHLVVGDFPTLLVCTYQGNLFLSELRECTLDVAVDILFFHEEVTINCIFSGRGIKEGGSWEIRQLIIISAFNALRNLLALIKSIDPSNLQKSICCE